MLKFMNLCHAPLTNWGLSLLDIQEGRTMLDIGCGGGATLRRLLKRSKGGMVYGIDISEESVAKARKVNAAVLDKQVFVTQGSAEKLPYEDWKFDLVTAVETIYFWPNLPQCLQEVRRVLKPGGHLSIVELTAPPHFPMKQLFAVYSHVVLPTYGRLISKDKSAYTYLTKTIEAFPQGEQMVGILQKAGFSKATFRRLTFGICTMYFATK